ncbi:MAG: GDP-mannose 4,6-dehydratase, partial [Candidatus Daviesbacteria bacterium GW2011_GWB1_41_5]
VVTDPHFIPPVQTGPLCGDPAKAKKTLGWKPRTTFKKLIEIMVHADLANFSYSPTINQA